MGCSLLNYTPFPCQSGNTTRFNQLWGNIGVERSYNPGTGSMRVLVAEGQSEKLHLAEVDVDTGTVTQAPLLSGALGSSSEGLLIIAQG